MINPEIQAELRAKYNPDGSLLRKRQLRMLEMLEYADSICKENGIRYWLSSGTCLGAVRHGGFIPWDDDTDIEMLKPDYQRFQYVMREKPHPGLALQTHDTDPEYFAPYGKIRDLNSMIEEDYGIDRHYKYRGVYIDVFVLEPSVSRILTYLSRGLQSRMQYPLSRIHDDRLRRIAAGAAYHILSRGVYRGLSLITNRKSSKRLRHLHGSCFVRPRYADDIFPLSSALFEGVPFPVPNDCHHYLSALYGNYMILPEPAKIHVHMSGVSPV